MHVLVAEVHCESAFIGPAGIYASNQESGFVPSIFLELPVWPSRRKQDNKKGIIIILKVVQSLVLPLLSIQKVANATHNPI